MTTKSLFFTFSQHPDYLIIDVKPEAKRSPKWRTLRKKWLKAHPNCAVCGTNQSLEVHHIIPVHVDPTLELNQSNLITLCEGNARICHYVFGHFYDWNKYNQTIREDAKTWTEKFASAAASAD